jgi:hypothetical protein
MAIEWSGYFDMNPGVMKGGIANQRRQVSLQVSSES